VSWSEAALVTGASSGIGRELARLFAENGLAVVLVARRLERLDELARELEYRHGAKTVVLAEDLTDVQAPARIYDTLRARDIEVEYLVNNAGFGDGGSFAHAELGKQLSMITLNIRALTHLTGLFVPVMVSRKRGKILNVGSTAGFQPGPYMATYYATKAFVNSFTEALAHELTGTGVTATLSCPGPTETEFRKIAGTEGTRTLKRPASMSASQVAREAYDAMMEGKPMVVHGTVNKALLQGLRLSPRAATRWFVAGINRED